MNKHQWTGWQRIKDNTLFGRKHIKKFISLKKRFQFYWHCLAWVSVSDGMHILIRCVKNIHLTHFGTNQLEILQNKLVLFSCLVWVGVSDRLSGLAMGVQAKIAELTLPPPADEGLSYASAFSYVFFSILLLIALMGFETFIVTRFSTGYFTLQGS